MNRFDRQLWQRFLTIAQPFFYPLGQNSSRVFLGLLLLLLAFLLATAFLSISIITLGSQWVFPQFFNQIAPGLLEYIQQVLQSPQRWVVALMFVCPMIAVLYYRKSLRSRWQTWLLLSGLLLLSVSVGLLNVIISYVINFFTSALASKNPDEFWRFLWVYGAAFAVGIPVVSLYWYTRDRLGNNWRKWLTESFIDKYFNHYAYYKLEPQHKIDNPDQRIAEDIKSLTVSSLKLIILVLEAIIDVVLFAGILWSISSKVSVYLLLYAFAGTIITVMLGKRLIPLNFNQLKQEADFRHQLVHVRDHAESIAFYQGEAQEKQKVKHYFANAFNNFNLLIGWQRNVDYFTTGYRYLVIILPYVVLAPSYFSGDIQYGDIIQANFAFRRILDSFSIVVDQIHRLGELGAGVNRLYSFSEALEQSEPMPKPGEKQINVVKNPDLSLAKITLVTPDESKTLVTDLSLTVKPHQGLLIVGESGVGKSSLLRMMAGLWTLGSGQLLTPDAAETLFLPQRPYMTTGNLREQLLYPHCDADVDEVELRQVLRRVNLGDLPERVDGFNAELDWGSVLSLGEQQRLAFARLLLTQPKYAILDEATSALDLKHEEWLYSQLQGTNMTYISVGHRPSLLRFHHQVLELTGNAQWCLMSVQEYQSQLYQSA